MVYGPPIIIMRMIDMILMITEVAQEMERNLTAIVEIAEVDIFPVSNFPTSSSRNGCGYEKKQQS